MRKFLTPAEVIFQRLSPRARTLANKAINIVVKAQVNDSKKVNGNLMFNIDIELDEGLREKPFDDQERFAFYDFLKIIAKDCKWNNVEIYLKGSRLKLSFQTDIDFY